MDMTNESFIRLHPTDYALDVCNKLNKEPIAPEVRVCRFKCIEQSPTQSTIEVHSMGGGFLGYM